MTASTRKSKPKTALWSQPVTWAVAAFAAAVMVALTAPSSDEPLRRTAIALIIGGAVVVIFAVRDRQRSMIPVAVALLGGGALLWADGARFVVPVTRGGGLIVLALAVLAGRATATRIGRLAGLATFVVFAGAAMLFFYFDRELLTLSLGAVGAPWVAVAVVGLNRARDLNELNSSLKFTGVFVLGVAAIKDRASNAAAGEPVRPKVLYEGAEREHRFFRFFMLMAFASAIASLGVIADSTAVVIGAMLVAPLLTPLMGMSLSLVMGWTEELGRAAFVAVVGMATAVGIGFLVAAVFGGKTDVATNTQIVSRVSPTLLDLGIALAAGAAGAYALSRSDVSDALPGVAVAIALVPPLAVVGITAQMGESTESQGALVLFGTNALAIVAMGAIVFVLTGTAAAEASRRWALDWWTIGFGALTVVVLAALVANTSNAREAGARTDRADAAVQEWIGDRDYEVLSVDVDGDDVSVVLSGPSNPNDIGQLGESLDGVLRGVDSVDVRIAITEVTMLEMAE